MFAIEMLPAKDGDCLWIEYGNTDKLHRVIIDGGPIGANQALRSRIEELPVAERNFELLIVTHIDSDHIAGILKLFQDPPEGLVIQQAWFNAYRHLVPGYLGALEAEFLTVYLKEEEAKRPGFWNGAFGGKAVVIPDEGPLPQCTLDGGLKLTVLAPDARALRALKKDWDKVIAEYMTPGSAEEAEQLLKKDKRYRPGYLGVVDIHGLANADFKEDPSSANGSSIVVVAEYGEKRCLLAADAWPSKVAAGLKRFGGTDARVALEAVKVPHHGSQNNNSNELYRGIDCPAFLVSTDGSKHDHPDQEAIARILENKRREVELIFNYRSAFNLLWDSDRLRENNKYATRYATDSKSGIRLEISV
jgi:beta-lactamase superfamily II metal-dependent hydrolase